MVSLRINILFLCICYMDDWIYDQLKLKKTYNIKRLNCKFWKAMHSDQSKIYLFLERVLIKLFFAVIFQNILIFWCFLNWLMLTSYLLQFVTAVETKTNINNSAAIFVANKSGRLKLNAQPENQILNWLAFFWCRLSLF